MAEVDSANRNLQFILDERARLEREGLLIRPRTLETPQGAWIVVDGKRVLNLASNNYLGLANHPRMKEAAHKAIDTFGTGPAAVRSIAGTLSLHLELERKLARFKRVESVLSFQSGFNSNVAVIPALVGHNDLIFSDELNHASIIDGSRLSGATVVRYEHCSAVSLERKLAEY
jgi:glycine C-acetyltransferase